MCIIGYVIYLMWDDRSDAREVPPATYRSGLPGRFPAAGREMECCHAKAAGGPPSRMILGQSFHEQEIVALRRSVVAPRRDSRQSDGGAS